MLEQAIVPIARQGHDACLGKGIVLIGNHQLKLSYSLYIERRVFATSGGHLPSLSVLEFNTHMLEHVQ